MMGHGKLVRIMLFQSHILLCCLYRLFRSHFSPIPLYWDKDFSNLCSIHLRRTTHTSVVRFLFHPWTMIRTEPRNVDVTVFMSIFRNFIIVRDSKALSPLHDHIQGETRMEPLRFCGSRLDH